MFAPISEKLYISPYYLIHVFLPIIDVFCFPPYLPGCKHLLVAPVSHLEQYTPKARSFVNYVIPSSARFLAFSYLTLYRPPVIIHHKLCNSSTPDTVLDCGAIYLLINFVDSQFPEPISPLLNHHLPQSPLAMYLQDFLIKLRPHLFKT